jgi:NTP pyrophosphatase (non-canonical NTP hydrolase)
VDRPFAAECLTAKGLTVNDAQTTVAELIKLIDDFVAERDWERFHDPKNLSMSMAIEAGELMEHFQWLRSDELKPVQEDERKMAQIREELADIIAYVLSFASTMGIDLSSALEDKMQKNALKYPVEEFRGRFQ